jgi:hypothetical protein
MAMIMMQDFHTTTDDDAYHCPSSSFPHSQPNNHCENRQTMIARWKDGFVSPTTSASESAASLLNLFGGGCNDNLNPIPTASTTTTASTSTTTTTTTMDAGAVMLLSRGQQQLLPRRGRLSQSQCNRRHLPDGENANIGNRNTAITTTTTTTRPVLLFQRTPTRVRFTTMTGILFLLPVSLLMSSCTTVALVYHTNLLLPTNILARRVVTNGGKKISILSTTSSSSTSLFYKFDANDSYSDPTTASATSTANSNNKNGGEEGENNNNNSCINSTNHSPLQFARAKRARKLHRHPSKKAKKKSGKESNDDIIVELLPSTFSNGDYYFNDDDDDDDEQTPFILSEPGEGESWTPPLPTVSSTSSSTASSFSASARRTTTASSPSSTSESCSKLDSHPALVLNADYQPLRMLPLSIWSWQDTIKAVLSGKAVVVDIHPNVFVRAVSLDMPVPSVIALREYAPTGKAVRSIIILSPCCGVG